jgi:aryl-alcohol dehydrogenase-like predicted oxidoreductase
MPPAMGRERSRREFLVLASAGMSLAASRAQAAGRALVAGSPTADRSRPVPRRPLGRTGAQVSILGIGGWHLGAVHDSRDAVEIVHRAMDSGVDFFDNAWEYHEGKSEEILGRALAGRRDRAFVMTKVCTHGRKADVAMTMLEQSLRRLGTSYVDLWQIHECIYDSDPDLHFQRDGVVDALARAKQQGKARFVGFTGHKDPSIHLRMLGRGFPFDTVQLPINCFDGTFRSFEQHVLPEVVKRGMAPIGMKSLRERAIRYARESSASRRRCGTR